MSGRAVKRRARPDRSIVAVAALVLAVEVIATMGAGDATESVRQLIRVTARTSLVWFVLAFVARPLVSVWPTAAARWLLRNRRYLGLALAISHGAHLVAIGVLASRLGDTFFASREVANTAVGALAYALLLAMVLTSTDRAQARLGRARWRALHLAGMWLFWLVFAASYLPGTFTSFPSALASLALLAGVALRIAAFVRRRKRQGTQ